MALRRILANQAKLMKQSTQTARTYHYDVCGRAIMGNTMVQKEPTEYFDYHYVPNNYPDSLSGFRIAYRNAFEVQHIFAYETWEYKYDGQWWHIGSFISNLLFFLTPAFLFLIISIDDCAQEARGGQTIRMNKGQSGFIHGQVKNPLQKPIQKDW